MSDVHVLPWTYTGAVAAGTVTSFTLMRAPSAAVGGGITVVAWGAASPTTIAVGSCPNFELVTAPTTGTNSTLNGTIASTKLGTVATNGFTAYVAQNATISDGFVDAGEYICMKIGAAAAHAGTVATGNLTINGWLQYVMGK